MTADSRSDVTTSLCERAEISPAPDVLARDGVDVPPRRGNRGDGEEAIEAAAEDLDGDHGHLPRPPY